LKPHTASIIRAMIAKYWPVFCRNGICWKSHIIINTHKILWHSEMRCCIFY
jgi:hypothetical protein